MAFFYIYFEQWLICAILSDHIAKVLNPAV